jgi:hypothetical protein
MAAQRPAVEPRFACFDDIVDHCYEACKKFVAKPWRIISIRLRDCATARLGPWVLINRAWY